jgi:Flp pilus assembly pilin Flp
MRLSLPGEVLMNHLIDSARAFGRDEEGGTASAYMVIAAVIAILLVSDSALVGDALRSALDFMTSELRGLR